METELSEMIERVARALTEEFEPHRVFDDGDAERLARVAIEAMRAPTEAMVSAGDDYQLDLVDKEQPGWSATAIRDSLEIWQTMIDAALGKAAS